MLLNRVLKFFITVFAVIIGATLLEFASPVLAYIISAEFLQINLDILDMTMMNALSILIGGIIGGSIGFISSSYCINKLRIFSIWVERQLSKMPTHDVVAGVLGLAIGLILANLLGVAFSRIPLLGPYIPIIFSSVFGYLGVYITIKKRKDIIALLPSRIKEDANKNDNNSSVDKIKTELNTPSYKLLDTSVIIDGRIADICKTGFIEGTLLIPVFVLEELQFIADSSDLLKRTRGRRGLDILKRIQTEFDMLVKIDHHDYDDVTGVDSKLIRLGQEIGAKIITNDFNLNKVADLQGVQVLNINELANAIKPVVIPGETMVVTVVKDGKEQGQGVAYLDDGTMIVVEGGHKHLNETLEVVVTSVLQTAAGRMIFAKPK